MISLQSTMLIALGFLVAALLALLIAPAFWTRAVRLTTRRITETLPITEAEIRADKDRLRAEYAMSTHRLETRIEQAELKRARYLVDLNRRDATITELENALTSTRAELEENQNARRVLEHTVADRLPKLDERLGEARKLVAERDAELNELATTTEQQVTALAEASAINAQQAAEVSRLKTSLTVSGARTHNSLQDVRTDAEVALRTEIDALRARSREQIAQIARLQAAQNDAKNNADPNAASSDSKATKISRAPVAPHVARPHVTPQVALVSPPHNHDADRERLERDLQSARSEIAGKTAELGKVSAELAALKKIGNGDGANTSPDSVLGLKAKVAGLEAERSANIDQITNLKSEAANLSEQLARQSAEFSEYVRRAGAGTNTTANSAARPNVQEPPRLSLAERVAQTRHSTNANVAGAAAATAATDADHEPDAPATRQDSAGTAASTPPEAPEPEAPRGRLIDRISSLTKA